MPTPNLYTYFLLAFLIFPGSGFLYDQKYFMSYLQNNSDNESNEHIQPRDGTQHRCFK